MTDTKTIKDRIDIVQLIGEYVKLKKAGTNWRANCPFHNEKSPSFMVHPEKQIWHCFGCSKGGDIFSFIEEIEGLNFIETLKFLAKRAGVAIDVYKNDVDSSLRNRLIEINTKASAFFNHILTDHPAGKNARDYLKNRLLNIGIISDWSIGFAPEQWDILTKYLLKKGYSIDDLVASGLTIKRDGADVKTGRGFYDRFRGRIMFPICDAHGTVIGFTGRVLVETENSGGKYVNTPATVLYDKSRVLYGLHKAKTEIKNKDLAILVEGQMDVIACHRAGMTNVVAVSGTALTADQVRILKRYTNNLAMAFDADNAGQNAGKRGSEVALASGMNIKIIQIPKNIAKDADECLQKNPGIWFKAVESAPGLMEWYFQTILAEVDKKNPASKQKATNELLEQISRIPFSVERDEWLKRLGDELFINFELLRSEIKKYKNTSQQSGTASTKPSIKLTLPVDTFEALLQEFWSLLVKFPQFYGEFREYFKIEQLVGTVFLPLYEQAEKLYTKDTGLPIDTLRAFFAKEGEENFLDVLILRPYKNIFEFTPENAKIELASLANRLLFEWRKKRGKEIQHLIMEATKNGDVESVQKLMLELQSFSS